MTRRDPGSPKQEKTVSMKSESALSAYPKTTDSGRPAPGDEVQVPRGPDRRRRPTSPWRNPFGPKRRKAARRKDETENTFVDRFNAKDVALLVFILTLNLLDALFTLLWIQRGGGEANPFMAYMLELGDEFFLAQKCFVVGVWLVLLTIHKNFKLARVGLYALAAVYTALLIGHITLVTQEINPGEPLTIQLGFLNEATEQGRNGRLDP